VLPAREVLPTKRGELLPGVRGSGGVSRRQARDVSYLTCSFARNRSRFENSSNRLGIEERIYLESSLTTFTHTSTHTPRKKLFKPARQDTRGTGARNKCRWRSRNKSQDIFRNNAPALILRTHRLEQVIRPKLRPDEREITSVRRAPPPPPPPPPPRSTPAPPPARRPASPPRRAAPPGTAAPWRQPWTRA
jgi:hypothetical protein